MVDCYDSVIPAQEKLWNPFTLQIVPAGIQIQYWFYALSCPYRPLSMKIWTVNAIHNNVHVISTGNWIRNFVRQQSSGLAVILNMAEGKNLKKK